MPEEARNDHERSSRAVREFRRLVAVSRARDGASAEPFPPAKSES